MSDFALILLAGPAALAAAGLFALTDHGVRPRLALIASRAATLAALGIAIVAAVALAAHGPAASPVLGLGGFGLQTGLDALSATLAVLVTFLGAVVVQFSRNYLDGDARQGAFLGWLCLTLAAVLALVVSGNTVQLVLAWLLIGVFIDRLLLFYPERAGARSAAHQKRVMSTVGGLILVAAMVILGLVFGTGEIAAIAAAAESGASTGWIALPAFGIVVAALLKSAAFPAHGWLTEVMETPTPVSALLHAGIVNAGGFLVIRFADLLLTVPYALHALALTGGIAAAAGSLVMITQTSVKVSLAWSTVAQMGFMLLQCGLGAFTSATLHIVAHSLYKAHAFLSSGSVVTLARARPGASAAPSLPGTVAALALSVGSVLAMAWLFGITPDAKPAILVFGLVLVLGLAHLAAPRLTGDARAAAQTAATLLAVAALYFVLQLGAEVVLADAMPLSAAADGVTWVLMAGALVVFTGIATLQSMLPAWRSHPLWQAAYVQIRNGFYASTLVNRLIRA